MIGTTNQEVLNYTKSNAPSMILALWVTSNFISVEEFQSTGYDIILSSYNNLEKLKPYIDANIKVGVWTVNGIEHFSFLWCAGLKYVITDNADEFKTLEAPIMAVNSPVYYLLWISNAIICCSILYLVLKSKKTVA
jgi:hypothetical protein